MSETITLVPNVGTQLDAQVQPFGNSPNTLDGNVADSSDSSYDTFGGNTGDAQAIARFNYGTYAIPSNKIVYAVREVLRNQIPYTNNPSGDDTAFESWFGDNAVTNVSTNRFAGPSGFQSHADGSTPPIQQLASSWQYQGWGGGLWTQAKIDDLSSWHKFSHSGSTTYYAYCNLLRAWLELDVRTQPTVALGSPTAGQSGISKNPTVTWVYTGFGEPQYKYRVKIFTQAVATGGGFNPETSTTVYDSGDTTSSASSHACTGANLTAGAVYYVYVKASKDITPTGTVNYWSGWAGANFTVNVAPSVTIDRPLTPVTTVTKPQYRFRYNDTDSDAMVQFVLKVFTQAQYTIGGFDPETSPNTYAATVVQSAAAGSFVTLDQPDALANGTYRVYVKAQQTIDATWSAWSNYTFVMNTAPPLAPTFTAVADNKNNRVTLTVNTGGGAVVPERYSIERQKADGSWVFVRAATSLAHTGAPIVAYDYEFEPNKLTTWRAVAYEQLTDTELASTPTTATATVSVKKVWVKNLSAPAQNVSIPVNNVWLPHPRAKQRTVHRPIGRTLPVVVRGISRGESFGMKFVMETEAKFDALMTVLDLDSTIYVQTSKSEWYVTVMSLTPSEHLWDELHGEAPAYQIDATFQEVEAP